jgi:hypothetical protein
MYKLYHFAQSSTAWRVRIALNLKQITPEYINVHLGKGEQRADSYAKLNPNKVIMPKSRAYPLWSFPMAPHYSKVWQSSSTSTRLILIHITSSPAHPANVHKSEPFAKW